MDSPGISTPRWVIRTFLDDRPHVPQYATLSPIAIQIHLLRRFRGLSTGAAGAAGEVSMDGTGISRPRWVIRRFLDDRPHVPQYATLSPIAIQIHLLRRFRGLSTGATTGDGACEDSRGGCHAGACDTGLPSGGTNPGLLIAPESNFAFCAASTVYIASVLCQRSLGSLRSASVMISTTSGGTSGTSSAIGLTSSRRIAVSVVIVESPWNAFVPVSISYITTPNEKMSLRASTFLPCACSGDMYATVPRIEPSMVSGAPPMVCVSSVSSVATLIFARPKSRIFTSPESVTITLPGLRSRWTIPAACAARNASAIWVLYCSVLATPTPPGGIKSASVFPDTSSITMYSESSSDTMSRSEERRVGKECR